MTDWETTKIKADVKAQAKEMDPTFTEIMQAGIDALNGSHTNTHTTEVVDATEIVDQLSQQIDSMAFDGSLDDETANRMIRSLNALEERTNKIERQLEELR